MKKKFTIEETQVITSTRVTTYEVEADSYEDALQSIQDGEEEPFDEESDDEFGESTYVLTGVEELADTPKDAFFFEFLRNTL